MASSRRRARGGRRSTGIARTTNGKQKHALIDEYRIAVNPVVLGEGTPLFRKRAERINLRLLGSKTFASGIVELRYAPEQDRQRWEKYATEHPE